MIDDILWLESVKGAELDHYLAKGWYRMGKYIFTTNLLLSPDGTHYNRVFWLRYCVDKVVLDKKNLQMMQRCSGFTVRYKKFKLTKDLVALHAKYVAHVRFETAKTLPELLMDINNEEYDSRMVEVRDGRKLIAAGILDKGKDTIAGIVNFYDPDYKNYSLGKFLMQMKYAYCKEKGYRYYYPGYYSPDTPIFDYKLFIDKQATEVYIPVSNSWIPYTLFLKILM